MHIKDLYAIIVTDKRAECRDFYVRCFGFQVAFEASWFVYLAATGDHAFGIAFMAPDHPSQPPGPERFNGKGMFITVQVSDATAEFDRLIRDGVTVTYPLRDEPWGQRRFGLYDPSGTWVDVIQQIDPAPGSGTSTSRDEDREQRCQTIVPTGQPLRRRSTRATTAREVLRGHDLKNKTAIVTGGHSGIGLEATRALAEAGATVVVPARALEKARASMGGMARVELEEMDLIDAASIDAFARRFVGSGRALHMLINNAGIMAAPLSRDARGYESQFATNHLGHFQLTLRLWPALKRAAGSGGARVVSLSSSGIRFGNVDFDDPNYQRRPYDRWNAYGRSKTANALFAVALDKRGYRDGIRAFSVHPGGIMTGLSRYMTEDEKRAYTGPLKTGEQGAATSVWCATSSQLDGKGGVYCLDCDIAEVVELQASEGRDGVIPWAIDPDSAERLWGLSENMTGVKFNS